MSQFAVCRSGATLPVSVVIRSYRRPAALLELLARLRAQTYPAFEVIVLEQSDDPRLLARLEAEGDPRLRVVLSAPRNPPAARNEALRHARGDILLFIDDDDLPLGRDWIAASTLRHAVLVLGRNGEH